MAVGRQRPRPVVERRGQPYERCLSQRLIRQSRAAVTPDGALAPQSRTMNRRIRNLTSDGAGGRWGQPRLLPDHCRWGAGDTQSARRQHLGSAPLGAERLRARYFTVIVMTSLITGGLCGAWLWSPSTSWSVCLPGFSSSVASVCPLPKWR